MLIELCEWKEINVAMAGICIDYVHMLVEII